MKPIIFTDLDGTLLDHHNYSFEAALPALRYLAEHHHPVIPVTSKTATEVAELREQLQLDTPFVVENGAAILFPDHYFSPSNSAFNNQTNLKRETIQGGEFFSVSIGQRRGQLDEILQDSSIIKLRAKISTFNDMGIQGIADTTQLSTDKSALANRRLASEPFLWSGSEEEMTCLADHCRQNHANIIRGGRFYHLLDRNVSKGNAMKILLEYYRDEFPEQQTSSVALGDGENDVPMLESADIAIVISSPNHPPPSINRHPNLIISQLQGPAGWNEEILKLMKAEIFS